MRDLLVGYGRLIRNRRYFPLWLGQLLSNLGDTLHYIALVVWVYQRTGSSLAVAATVFFAQGAPGRSGDPAGTGRGRGD